MVSGIALDFSWDMERYCYHFLGSATIKVTGQPDVALSKVVLSEPVTWRDLEATGGYVVRRGSMFVWPKRYTARPTIGSHIVDENGDFWTIWTVLDKQHTETWECQALNLSIVPVLQDVALVLRATYVKGQANEAHAEWRGFWSGKTNGRTRDYMRAHFQPADATIRVQFGAEWTDDQFKVYLNRSLDDAAIASANVRLRDRDGTWYQVLKYYNAQQIAKLPVLLCRRILEGAQSLPMPPLPS